MALAAIERNLPLDLPRDSRHNRIVSCEFETVDICGVPVTCTHDTWDGHVLVRHSELQGLEHLAVDAVRDPDLAYDSGTRSNRKLFYREAVQPLPFDDRYILVVVAYDDLPGGEVGVVVTAHPINGILQGNKLVWQR